MALLGEGDVIENVAHVGATLMAMAEDHIEQSGTDIAPEVIEDASDEVLMRVLRLAIEGGMIAPEEAEGAIEEIAQKALQAYEQMSQGGGQPQPGMAPPQQQPPGGPQQSLAAPAPGGMA